MGQALGLLVLLLNLSIASLAQDAPQSDPPSSSAQRISCAGTPFSCEADSVCKSLLPDNSTILCCPATTDCLHIAPIDCNIQHQNKTLVPDSQVFTTRLNATLETCGTRCCPLGYSCASDSICVFENSPTATSSSTTTPTATANSSPSSSAVLPAPTAAQSAPPPPGTADASVQPHQNRFPAKAVILGLGLGLVFALLGTLLVVWLIRRRRRQQASKCPASPSFLGRTPPASNSPNPMVASRFRHAPASAVGRVSEPMWAASPSGTSGTHRTDFLRRGDVKTNEANVFSGSNLRAKVERATSITLKRCRSKRVDQPPPPMSARIQSGAVFAPTHRRERSSAQKPLFDDATRFGVPILTANPVPRRRPQPERPPRSDEYVPPLAVGPPPAPPPTKPLPPIHPQPQRAAQGDVMAQTERQDRQQRHSHQQDTLLSQRTQRLGTAESDDTWLSSQTENSSSSALRRHSSDYGHGEVMTVHLDTPSGGAGGGWTPVIPDQSLPRPLFSSTSAVLQQQPRSFSVQQHFSSPELRSQQQQQRQLQQEQDQRSPQQQRSRLQSQQFLNSEPAYQQYQPQQRQQQQSLYPARSTEQRFPPRQQQTLDQSRPATTFADLMVRAGWKETDGWHLASGPSR